MNYRLLAVLATYSAAEVAFFRTSPEWWAGTHFFSLMAFFALAIWTIPAPAVEEAPDIEALITELRAEVEADIETLVAEIEAEVAAFRRGDIA